MTSHHRPAFRRHNLEAFFDELRPNQRARLPVGIEQDDIRRLLSHACESLWLRSVMRLRSRRNRSCKRVPDQVGISDIQELKLMPEKATLERARRDRRA